jgi:glutamyl-tRNA reductase
MKKRKNRPMFLIDIAVPRDIEPRINDVGNAYVYDIDDLKTVVDTNLKIRENEAKKAEIIIEAELEKMEEWMVTLEVIPTIKQFRERILELSNAELAKGLKQVGDLSSKQERAIRSMVNSLAYKILHQPTVMLKQKAKEGTNGVEYIQVLNDLFDLSPVTEKKSSRKVINLK